MTSRIRQGIARDKARSAARNRKRPQICLSPAAETVARLDWFAKRVYFGRNRSQIIDRLVADAWKAYGPGYDLTEGVK